MSTDRFALDLDEMHEELWYELEKIQDGSYSHRIMMNGRTKREASEELAVRLIPFFIKYMYECDEQGYNTKE